MNIKKNLTLLKPDVQFVLYSLQQDDPLSWKKTVPSDYGKYESLHCSQGGGNWFLLRATLNRSALNTLSLSCITIWSPSTARSPNQVVSPDLQTFFPYIFPISSFLLAQQRPVGQRLLIHEVSRSHTTTQHSRLVSYGQVISSSQRPLHDKQLSQQTDIHAPGGIRTHNLSRRTAVDLHLRLRGHWDRLYFLLQWWILHVLTFSSVI